MRIGFDNDKYISLQAEKIRERIGQFGGKLYLEFGGKLFDDYHASRVLPGFEPDSKIRMLESLADDVEAIIVINADNIENAKRRSDIGITYEEDALRTRCASWTRSARAASRWAASASPTSPASPTPRPSSAVSRAWASRSGATT